MNWLWLIPICFLLGVVAVPIYLYRKSSKKKAGDSGKNRKWILYGGIGVGAILFMVLVGWDFVTGIYRELSLVLNALGIAWSTILLVAIIALCFLAADKFNKKKDAKKYLSVPLVVVGLLLLVVVAHRQTVVWVDDKPVRVTEMRTIPDCEEKVLVTVEAIFSPNGLEHVLTPDCALILLTKETPEGVTLTPLDSSVDLAQLAFADQTFLSSPEQPAERIVPIPEAFGDREAIRFKVKLKTTES